MNEEEIKNLIKELFNEDNKEELLVVLKALKRLVPNDRLKSEYLIELLSYFDGAIHGEEVSSKESYEMLNIYGRKAIDLLSLKELEERRKFIQSKVSEGYKELGKIRRELEEIESRKIILDTYKEELKKLENSKSVSWYIPDTGNPIYNTNHWTINSYIKSIKLEYMQETGCSEKQCERDFEIYSPFLGELLDLFNNHFRNDEITATSSITAILECKNWDKEGEALVARLEAILANLKLPKYNKLVSSKEDEFVKTKKLLKKSKK